MEDLAKRIRLLDLPRTFRDAVTVCRALGIDYLWIDCLCIVQDCQQDWEEQSCKMVRVYSDALVTIAADAAENSEAGFVDGAREAVRSQVRLLSSAYQIYARPKPEKSTKGGFYCHSYPGTRKKSWLADRGWTLQEKLLSPRILHFTEGELSWECASSSRCECRGRHPIEYIYGVVRPQQLESAEGWKRVTEEYTRRHLTYATDRLAALAGLAAQAQLSRPGARYLGGLWEDDLPYCLLWNTEDARSCRRVRPAVAPSWSWAGLSGGRGVENWQGQRQQGQLGDVVVEYPAAASNPYGSLPAGRRASLTATAGLCECRVAAMDRTTYSSTHAVLEVGGSAAVEGWLYPDTREDLERLEAGELAVLMDVADCDVYIVLRRLGGCDCTFQRIGLYKTYFGDVIRLGGCTRKRITII